MNMTILTLLQRFADAICFWTKLLRKCVSCARTIYVQADFCFQFISLSAPLAKRGNL